MINSSQEITMNYHKIYDALVTRGKNRVLTGYKEKHHIIPRCMGGTDELENLVWLTPEEHYVCHLLLVKIHPGSLKLVKAAMFMVSSNSSQQRSNKVYGWLKRQYSDYMKGDNNPTKINGPWNKGKSVKTRQTPITESEKHAHSKRMTQNNPCAGVKPWNHPRATDYTKGVWSNADHIKKVWEDNNKPSYCRLYSLVNGRPHGKDWEAIGPYMNLVKYFRNGWEPNNDNEWKNFK